MGGKGVCRMFLVAVVAGALLLPASGVLAAGAEAGAFTIERLVVCKDVQNREPVEAAEAFPADTAKVFAFLEARDIPEDTSVSFVWYNGDQELANIAVKIGKSSRWRTFTNKTLYGMKGAWRVEVRDANNNVLGTADFKVE